MRRLAAYTLILVTAAAMAGLFVTRPRTIPADEIAGITPDLQRGEWVFNAAGCASCHIAPGAEKGDIPVLAGGKEFVSEFGVFVAPNISSGPEGIGNWTDLELVTAVMAGTSPEGEHYYPAFPFASYAKASVSDVVSLVAYLRTLPSDATPSAPHRLGFPYSIRAGVGLWKLLYMSDDWVEDAGDDPELVQGRYIAEALAHCGECHTPRTGLGGLYLALWFDGAANPSGDGRIPGISRAKLDWSKEEITAYLTDGFTPDFDVAGGSMRAVVEGMAKLPEADRAAVAAYLTSVGSGE